MRETGLSIDTAKTVTIERIGATPLVGILRYASAWNPPDGCYRISYSEAMSASKCTEVANTQDAVITDEVAHSFKTSLGGLGAASCAMICNSGDTALDKTVADGKTNASSSSSWIGKSTGVGAAHITFEPEEELDEDVAMVKDTPKSVANEGSTSRKRREPSSLAAEPAPKGKRCSRDMLAAEKEENQQAVAEKSLEEWLELMEDPNSLATMKEATLKDMRKKLMAARKASNVASV